MVAIDQCPICNGRTFENVYQCTDFTTTREKFSVVKCTHCKFHLTSPRPDDDQLGKYYQSEEYISHTNKSTNLINTVYKTARKFTLASKVELVKKYINHPVGAKILDYGCGTGNFLESCKMSGLQITGVEPSDDARKTAALNTGVKIHQAISEVTEKQDVITLWHVLEHIPDLHDLLNELKDRLLQNGVLIIAVPNRESWDAGKYKDYWAAFDVPRHLWHFSKKDVSSLMNSHNLTVTEILPMKLDSYYVSLLSEKNRSNSTRVSGIINAVKNGFISNLKAKENNYSSLIYVIKHQ